MKEESSRWVTKQRGTLVKMKSCFSFPVINVEVPSSSQTYGPGLTLFTPPCLGFTEHTKSMSRYIRRLLNPIFFFNRSDLKLRFFNVKGYRVKRKENEMK